MILMFHIIFVVLLMVGLSLLFWIDLRQGLLPDIIMGPLVGLGLVVMLIDPLSILTIGDCIWGGLIGSGFMWMVRLLSSRIFKREALGWGDVKFMGMAGLWVGWQGLNPILVGGVLISLLIAGVRMWIKSANAPISLQSHTEIPLGPGLCVALGIVALFNLFGITPGPAFVPF